MALQGAHATGTYYNLGAGITASGSSADGGVVGAYTTSLKNAFYKWTPATGLVNIGGNWRGGIASVSADGSILSGSALGSNGNTQAASYNVASGKWTTYGGIGGSTDSDESSGWGIAGDGSSVVGLGWVNAGSAHAVQSTPSNTLVDLGSPADSRANGTNYDGSISVGWSTQSGWWAGTYWKNGALTVMDDGSGGMLSSANAISSDGQWIVGDGDFDHQTWRYNVASGVTEYLGDYDSFTFFQGATGVSADGSVIVGYDRDFGPATWGVGTIWIEGQGISNLTDYVLGQGVDLQGRTLALPMGVSADGLTFYGIDNAYEGFVVTLAPVPEPTTWALFGLGLAGVAAVARRRRPALRA